MLRKITLFSTLLCSTFCFSGTYVGGTVGPEWASFNQRSHVVGADFDVIDKEHFSGTGVFGSLFAGYDMIKSQNYWAVEIHANLSSVEYKLVNDEYIHSNFSKTTFTIKNSEGISLLPGYLFSPNTLGYLRVGYINGHFKSTQSDPTIASFNSHLNGVRYGLGMRYKFSEQWSLALDCSQARYSSVNSRIFEPFGKVTKESKMSSNTSQVGLGVLYYWS